MATSENDRLHMYSLLGDSCLGQQLCLLLLALVGLRLQQFVLVGNVVQLVVLAFHRKQLVARVFVSGAVFSWTI